MGQSKLAWSHGRVRLIKYNQITSRFDSHRGASGLTQKNVALTHLGRSHMIVLSAGIEPASTPSEGDILSIERRERMCAATARATAAKPQDYFTTNVNTS